MDVTVVTAICVLFLEECLCKETLPEQRNLPRPVLQTEITNDCVFPDLLVMTVKTVLIHAITLSGLTQLSNEKF